MSTSNHYTADWRLSLFRAKLLASVVLVGNLNALTGATLLAEQRHLHIRFATFNVSLYGSDPASNLERMGRKDDTQAAAVAEIIQRVRPDVLLLNEFDFTKDGLLLERFRENYLSNGRVVAEVPEDPAEPICFPYHYVNSTNTGIHSGHDLDRNGRMDSKPLGKDFAGDSWGFGHYPGQYGMVLLSRFPILSEEVRTFRTFRWRDMPGALLPDDPGTQQPDDWYSSAALEQFPLSSKSHWDVPIQIDDQVIHVLASHPTPPTFDGPEDRNGRRNHDEIRFWVDYITPGQGDYIYDDNRERGGLSETESFVVMGDLNGDPHDGEGTRGIRRLLAADQLAGYPPPESKGGAEQAKRQGGANNKHVGNPRQDTLDGADYPGPGNLRLDYVLPSKDLTVLASGVFWPKSSDSTFPWVGTHPFPSSDHRLVWVDIKLELGE